MILKTKLKPWQVKAVEKLIHIKIGALYMEQGTGKTRTTLELIKERINAGKVVQALWLCPCSVKSTIKDEIQKHVAAGGECIRIEGIESLSSSIRLNSELLNYVKSARTYIVVDESNLVKNNRAKRTKNITKLAKLCKYKLILNGTPVSRNEVDLFSQWYILDWRILGYQSFWSFAANHIEWDDRIPGRVRRCLNVDYLVRKIAPYTYQVTKAELVQNGLLSLPSKYSSTEYYWMTDEQFEHYADVADELMFDLENYESAEIYRLFAGLQDVISGYFVTVGKHIQRRPFFKNPLDNPRIQTLLNLVDMEEKYIIFCKYTDEINIIVNILNNKYGKDAAAYFYGDIKLEERNKNIEKFRNKSNFLVANKQCGAYGLNLQFCHNIIYYTNDWDYATRAQSEDRIYRIGQEKVAHIIDICARRTLDERILDCLSKKENLVDSFKNQINNQKDKKEFLSNWIKIKEDVSDDKKNTRKNIFK